MRDLQSLREFAEFAETQPGAGSLGAAERQARENGRRGGPEGGHSDGERTRAECEHV